MLFLCFRLHFIIEKLKIFNIYNFEREILKMSSRHLPPCNEYCETYLWQLELLNFDIDTYCAQISVKTLSIRRVLLYFIVYSIIHHIQFRYQNWRPLLTTPEPTPLFTSTPTHKWRPQSGSGSQAADARLNIRKIDKWENWNSNNLPILFINIYLRTNWIFSNFHQH